VSGLTGADAEHKKLEQLLLARLELVGAP